MKPLAKLRLEQAMLKPPKKNSALLWLEESQAMERELRKVWEEKMEKPATDVMLALVNTGDSPDDLREFRPMIPRLYDIARESDSNLLALRDELRTFWDELARERTPEGPALDIGDNTKVAVALQKWWKRYELDSDGYFIFWETGTFFPTQKNFRGVVARVLFAKRRYLARCPNCEQYFIKRRDDQKYCLVITCQRRANNLRQQKHQVNKKKSARKSRERV